MYTKETVWLIPDEILRKYPVFCFERHITERFIVKLFDAHLLRGHMNRKLKKVEILEESWLDLIVHINYNLYLSMYHPPGEIEKISIPSYCKLNINQKPKSVDQSWHTPSEILEMHKPLFYEKVFTTEFIGDLVLKGVLRGRYDTTDKCHYVLLPSFTELMRYRDYTIRQNLYFGDSNNPPTETGELS